jgi:hypothetical protein
LIRRAIVTPERTEHHLRQRAFITALVTLSDRRDLDVSRRRLSQAPDALKAATPHRLPTTRSNAPTDRDEISQKKMRDIYYNYITNGRRLPVSALDETSFRISSN